MVLRFLLEIDDETVVMTVDYQDFIRRLRVRLGVRYSHNVRALAVQADPPPGLCDVLIETNEYSVRFRLRVDNLYLVGYQMRGGPWLEFDRTDNHHLIPGSQYLGFNCSYVSMGRTGNQSLTRTRISLYDLETAVETLAIEEGMEPRAQNLMVVSVMISEAARFIPITDELASRPQFRIPEWMENLVHSWGVFSGALFRADAYPDERFLIPDNDVIVIPPNREIRTLADVISIIGILLGLCYNQPRMSLRLTLSEGQPQCFVGVPLLEVFSVTINYITGEEKGNLFGGITITNGLYSLYIYNRTKNNPESIIPSLYIDLTGPSQALSAFGNISLAFHLLLNDTDTFIDKTILWDAFNLGSAYDRRISVPLDSARGSLTVNYAVLRNAVAATLTVTLREAYEGTTEVYGRIYAYYDSWRDSEARSWLFHKGSPDYVSVDRGDNIPLLRSVVAVPLNGNGLKITAHLLDYDPVSDDVIVDGTFEFSIPDSLPSSISKDSTEKGGNMVRVTVNWSSGF